MDNYLTNWLSSGISLISCNNGISMWSYLISFIKVVSVGKVISKGFFGVAYLRHSEKGACILLFELGSFSKIHGECFLPISSSNNFGYLSGDR